MLRVRLRGNRPPFDTIAPELQSAGATAMAENLVSNPVSTDSSSLSAEIHRRAASDADQACSLYLPDKRASQPVIGSSAGCEASNDHRAVHSLGALEARVSQLEDRVRYLLSSCERGPIRRVLR